MRDLLFKNLTSFDKTKRRIASSEIVDKQGVRSIIHRHFICLIKEVKDLSLERPLPYLNILKVRNNKEQMEKFFCRLKNSIYAIYDDKVYLILFMHSLKVTLSAVPQDILKCDNQ